MPPQTQIIRFAGLMSRWMRPAAWASASAPQACRSRCTTRPGRQRPVEPHELREIDAAHELHRVVEDPLGRAPVVVDRDRARVSQAGGQLDLPLEPRERALALRAGREQLHGGRPPQQGMARLPNDAHRALAEARDEAVRPDLLDLAAQAQDRPQRGQRDEAEERGDECRPRRCRSRRAAKAGTRRAAGRPARAHWRSAKGTGNSRSRSRFAAEGPPPPSVWASPGRLRRLGSRSARPRPEASIDAAAVSTSGATRKIAIARPGERVRDAPRPTPGSPSL